MMIALPERPNPLVWPADWRRTPSIERSRAPYRASFVDTRNLIIDELKLMVTGRVSGYVPMVLSSDIPVKRDGTPYADYDEPADPGAAVWWVDRNQETRAIACDRWNTVAGNFRAIALSIQHLRGLERTGASQIFERSMQNFRVPKLPGGLANTRPWWCETLGLDHWPASHHEIQDAYRTLVKTTHPDRGGDQQRFVQINEAKDRALEALRVA